MELTRTELIDIGLDALEAEASDLPDGLAPRLLSAAMTRRRPALHAAWATSEAELSSHAAFITTAVELSRLLETLAPYEWARPTQVAGGVSVRDLVLHLVGVERYLLGQLGRRDPLNAPQRDDHFPVARAAATDLDGADDSQVARAWWLEVMQVVAACAEVGPDHEVAYHHLGGSVRGTLVIRTFELWTHENDIRRAVALPFNELDDRRLSLMSTALMESFPLGMALARTRQPGRTVHFDLTGSGGGKSFDVALAPDEVAGIPDLTIEVRALDLCRLAANRLSIDEIDVKVFGDRSLLGPVLVGAGAFALD